MRKIILLLAVASMLGSCLKDDPFKLEYNGFIPKSINDDWQISTPENESIDVSTLEQAYALVYSDKRFTMARSLLVFRNGKLVAEAYPHDPSDIDAIHNIQSCTKSITSILTGIAIQNNYIDSLDERLYDVYPEYFDSDINKRNISIEDALTMQTGLEFDNGSHTKELYKTEINSVQYVLSMKRLYNSGTFMNYNDGAPHLVSKVIEKKTGMTLCEYADATLFKPLNINDWEWESAKDGTTFGAFSLFLKPRDFGKIGQLILQNGKWNNKPFIDSTYLSEATSIKVSANFSSEPYGYYFWILPAYNGYAAIGHGGQFLFVVPEKQLVVIYTAWPYTSGDFFDQRNDLMRIIVNSCN
ncbi:MAG: beta-lactamase family protein [Bacteroidales bacterium]|nr:beta-lactamase family protein [Bacteroidales bacterium]MCF8404368.1 beta-lactamase family protein [Bacteroidales bacterium]